MSKTEAAEKGVSWLSRVVRGGAKEEGAHASKLFAGGSHTAAAVEARKAAGEAGDFAHVKPTHSATGERLAHSAVPPEKNKFFNPEAAGGSYPSRSGFDAQAAKAEADKVVGNLPKETFPGTFTPNQTASQADWANRQGFIPGYQPTGLPAAPSDAAWAKAAENEKNLNAFQRGGEAARSDVALVPRDLNQQLLDGRSLSQAEWNKLPAETRHALTSQGFKPGEALHGGAPKGEVMASGLPKREPGASLKETPPAKAAESAADDVKTDGPKHKKATGGSHPAVTAAKYAAAAAGGAAVGAVVVPKGQKGPDANLTEGSTQGGQINPDLVGV